MIDLTMLTDTPVTSTEVKTAKANSYTFQRQDDEQGIDAELKIDAEQNLLIPLSKILEFCKKGVVTKSGKEAYCTLTAPKGSISMLNKDGKVVVLNNIRFGMNAFVKIA